MQTIEDARRLARTMVNIGYANGRRVTAAITSMEQPLGRAIGNALEVREAIMTLQGHGPEDLTELCLTLGAHLALLAGVAETPAAGRARLQAALDDGTAWHKWRAFVANQGGDLAAVDDPRRLPAAAHQEPIRAPGAGSIAAIDALVLGLIAGELGGGRQRKGDQIDPAVGIVLERKVGERVERGDILATLHTRTARDVEQVRARLMDTWSFTTSVAPAPPLVYEIVAETT
jgi:pyrimidine-nucleoside phosphorylase